MQSGGFSLVLLCLSQLLLAVLPLSLHVLLVPGRGGTLFVWRGLFHDPSWPQEAALVPATRFCSFCPKFPEGVYGLQAYWRGAGLLSLISLADKSSVTRFGVCFFAPCQCLSDDEKSHFQVAPEHALPASERSLVWSSSCNLFHSRSLNTSCFQ